MLSSRNRATFAPDGGAASDLGAPDAVGTTPTAPAAPAQDPAAPPTLPAPPPAPPAEFDWAGALGGDYDQHKPVIEAKGWKSPGAALAAYRELEKLVGAKPASADAYSAFQRPADVTDDHWSDNHEKAFRTLAFDAGLTDAQAQRLRQSYITQAKAGLDVIRQQQEQAEQALRTEWGTNYDRNIETARRAVQKFGAGSGELLDVLEKRVGGAQMIRLFHSIGSAMSEDTLAGSGGGASAGMPQTPEAARAEIDRLRGDQDFLKSWMDRSHSGHADAKRRMDALYGLAYPNQKG
ncbi:hypothetical protein [Azospirillum sp. sgz302134]